jgi:hypothetical protein
VALKEKKTSLDARLNELNRSFDSVLGVADLMTRVMLGAPGSFGTVVDALKDQSFQGSFAPFHKNKAMTAKRLLEYFEALAKVMGDRPASVWGGDASVEDRLRSAFPYYTQCQATSIAVLGKLIDPSIGDEAVRTVKDGSATTGTLRGLVSYRRGLLRANNVGAFPTPTRDAAILMNGLDHIFVVVQVDRKWRIYQSFQNRYTISQSGLGNTEIDDFPRFLAGITSADNTTWFGQPAGNEPFSYLILQ